MEMESQPSSKLAVAEAFAAALDAGDDKAAAALLDEDVELVFPGRSIHGRAAWLAARSERPQAAHLKERFEDVAFTETEDGIETEGTPRPALGRRR